MLASTWVPAEALIDCTTQGMGFLNNIEVGGSGGRRFTKVHQKFLSKFGMEALRALLAGAIPTPHDRTPCSPRSPAARWQKATLSRVWKEKALLFLGEESLLCLDETTLSCVGKDRAAGGPRVRPEGVLREPL